MTITLDLAQAVPLEDEVVRIRRLQQDGAHSDALAAAQARLLDWPENRDLLLLAAVSLRHLRRVPEAMALLDRLALSHPGFSRLHQERGLCHVQLKDATGAIAALLQAVNLNPALPASWAMLARLYGMTGEADNAATAAEHVATLEHLPAEVVTATSLFSDGDLAPAEQIVRAFLLRAGDHPEGMRLLARIALAHDVLDEAEILLAAVLEMAPDYAAARYDYAQTLIKRQKHADAQAPIAPAPGGGPGQPRLPHPGRDGGGGPWAKRRGHRHLPPDGGRSAPVLGRAPVARPCAEDRGPGSRGHRVLPRGGGGPA